MMQKEKEELRTAKKLSRNVNLLLRAGKKLEPPRPAKNIIKKSESKLVLKPVPCLQALSCPEALSRPEALPRPAGAEKRKAAWAADADNASGTDGAAFYPWKEAKKRKAARAAAAENASVTACAEVRSYSSIFQQTPPTQTPPTQTPATQTPATQTPTKTTDEHPYLQISSFTVSQIQFQTLAEKVMVMQNGESVKNPKDAFRKFLCETGMMAAGGTNNGGNYTRMLEGPKWTMKEYMKDGIVQWGTMNAITDMNLKRIELLRKGIPDAEKYTEAEACGKDALSTYTFDREKWNANGYRLVVGGKPTNKQGRPLVLVEVDSV